MNAIAKDVQAATQPPSLELVSEVQQFYYREARLKDRQDYRAWLALLTDDIHYWMPARVQRYRRDERPPSRLDSAYYNDSMRELDKRITRLETDTCWTEDPATRTAHLVHNVEVEHTENADEYRVHSISQVYRNMNEDEEHTLYCLREDLLRRVDGQLRVARRLLTLQQNIFMNKSLNVFP
ncbi:MAG: 3-phenylpropionate/cinnamic acid dioxygenase subunit beta [Immundisolibacter sp.]|uniref:3-phenylpropionate/cinnamic acid dioxygenase subunit beta n=1 Tax=Immundisolibacter sp. TaxID=1934948 RepID=UPI00356AF7AD